ncbi:surface-adhesin E family protein [Novosphingobium sp.]|jgi:hypothetical protein|uniref:surface-adhesin E family protein n=1 Tax=Novosphingobium sp. TaxID=1874826 RepID=UPI002FE3AC98
MRFAWVGLALAAISIPAQAEWVEWSTSTSGSVWYIDRDRMVMSPGKVKLWVKEDHSRDASVKARSSMMQISINCRSEKYFITARIEYDAYGKVIYSNSRDESEYGYEPIIPDTMVEGVSSAACQLDQVKQ